MSSEPNGLSNTAVGCFERLGSPKVELALAQAVVYLDTAPPAKMQKSPAPNQYRCICAARRPRS